MHVLGNIGHGFGQRRKTATPKDLQIRKVSFSGCSLSGTSVSSSSSTSTARLPMPSSAPPRMGSGSNGASPLSQHPTFQPPPRLHERPMIIYKQSSPYASQSIFHDDSTDDESFGADDEDRETMVDEEEYTLCRAEELHFSQPKEMVLQPSQMTSADQDDSSSDSRDYYMLQLAKRPAMPCSRWSDSTIQTLDFDDFSDDDESDASRDSGLEMPNFSRKRCTAPSRPPMRSLDTLDHSNKGGWKRRGVVFNASEIRQHSAEF
ncbi:hypothetical protein E4U21_003294 [Claviceps maximensis]|nr:hypothetical protein E4U21_003294 [Claviceps maximensis]